MNIFLYFLLNQLDSSIFFFLFAVMVYIIDQLTYKSFNLLHKLILDKNYL